MTLLYVDDIYLSNIEIPMQEEHKFHQLGIAVGVVEKHQMLNN